MLIELWTINKWLRWTGFRLTVGFPSDVDGPTLIGLRWWGFADLSRKSSQKGVKKVLTKRWWGRS